MYIYHNNFWDGFGTESDGLLPLFLKIFTRVFETPIENTSDPNKADILLESIGVNGQNSYIQYKSWKYKILFSGESRLCPQYELYDCILWGRESEGKIICLPLAICYMLSTGALERIKHMDSLAKTGEVGRRLPPYKKILAVISNPNSTNRNFLLNVLERYFLVDYAGKYRTNRPVIMADYDKPEFWNEVSKYRCVLTLENSQDTHYITEKIVHGMTAGVVPIYWGAPSVTEYFNPARFIHIKDLTEENVKNAMVQIHRVLEDDYYYRNMVNEPIMANGIDPQTAVDSHIDHIVDQMRALLLNKS